MYEDVLYNRMYVHFKEVYILYRITGQNNYLLFDFVSQLSHYYLNTVYKRFRPKHPALHEKTLKSFNLVTAFSFIIKVNFYGTPKLSYVIVFIMCSGFVITCCGSVTICCGFVIMCCGIIIICCGFVIICCWSFIICCGYVIIRFFFINCKITLE